MKIEEKTALIKQVRVRFKVEAYFDGYVEVDDQAYEKLKEVVKDESNAIYHGSELHSALMDIVKDRETFDYVDYDADIEEIEIDEDEL